MRLMTLLFTEIWWRPARGGISSISIIDYLKLSTATGREGRRHFVSKWLPGLKPSPICQKNTVRCVGWDDLHAPSGNACINYGQPSHVRCHTTPRSENTFENIELRIR